MNAEIERLNYQLKLKNEEFINADSRLKKSESDLDASKKRIFELEHSISGELQSKLAYSAQENEDLKYKLKQLTSYNTEYETRMTKYVSEIERLNGILRTKVDELNASDSRIKNYEIEMELFKKKFTDYESTVNRDVKGQFGLYEQKINTLSQESEDNRKKLA